MNVNEAVQVRIRRLSRSFQEGKKRHVVLNGIELDVLRGETLALVGRSGSGKSTLLNLISGIDIPDGGHVEIAGVNITDLHERERTLFRRAKIGFVYQFFNLIETLTVDDNLRLVLELNGVGRGECSPRIDELLNAVGLLDRKSSYPDSLSGGEQQRVAIARALVHRPELLIADEPTGNLDHTTAEAVVTLLEKLTRKAGKTMIVATHSRTLAAVCDRTIEIHDGKIVPERAAPS